MNYSKYQDSNDSELLRHFYEDHDNEWLGILLSRYTMLLLGVCMKYLKNEDAAKESVQQVFEKVISELHKYRVEYFKSWLYMVAKNHCLMKLRAKGHVISEINERVMTLVEEEECKEDILEKELMLEHLETALQQLNAEQRDCVTLFYLEKKSYQAISEQTGYSLMQVKSHIQNGKRNLKLILLKMHFA